MSSRCMRGARMTARRLHPPAGPRARSCRNGLCASSLPMVCASASRLAQAASATASVCDPETDHGRHLAQRRGNGGDGVVEHGSRMRSRAINVPAIAALILRLPALQK
jgi:hypothetical protein